MSDCCGVYYAAAVDVGYKPLKDSDLWIVVQGDTNME
jgi:hypothetical protein